MVSLIANSGIQFHTVPIDLGSKSSAMGENVLCFEQTHPEDEHGNKLIEFVPPSDIYDYNGTYIKKSALNPDAIDSKGKVIEEKILPDYIHTLREDGIISIPALVSLDVFEGVWIPVPYFRLQHYDRTQVHQGPQTWARMLLSRRKTHEQGQHGQATHDLTFAFDTNCTKAEEVNLFEDLVPTISDAEIGAHFVVVADDLKILFWLDKPWLSDWLQTECKRKRKILERRFPDFDQLHWLHIGIYLSLLKSLAKAAGFPEISLNTSEKPIEVDLVLDVGNSRTCGLVVESAGTNSILNITDAKPLKIRHLSRPSESTGDPFEMKLAFVKETFGEESAAVLSQNKYAFQYPSLVRVGKEAVDLSTLFDTGDTNSIFSSPKRYMWDDQKVEHPWTHIPLNNEPMARPAIYGISEKFTEDGRLLARAVAHAQKRNLLPPYPGLDARFSRRSLMTFALIEIILQAATYINNFEYRNARTNKTTPRKLRRIVLTCPTAMLKTEKVLLREAALDALAALKEHFGTLVDASPEIDIDYDNPNSIQQEKFCPVIPAPSSVAKPDLADADLEMIESLDDRQKRLEWGFDEATCSQLTFIFREINHRFKRENAKLYFDTVGKVREGTKFPGQQAVTLASIDIGGGTTDLMIATYQTDPDANVPVLTPDPLFWEGFNLAGDNLLKRLIEQTVLPAIGEAVAQAGAGNYIHTMNALFGPFHGGQSHQDRIMKRYFVQQIALPIAYGIMQHAQENLPVEKRSFGSFFLNYNAPNPNLMQYINDYFIRNGAQDFDLRQIEWTLDTRLTNKVVRNIFEKMLRDLCSIITLYDVDYVLLSGRPTTLPVVRDILLEYLPAAPDRIVPLGNYRVGEWYPFAKDGFIRDPKTCVAVGAAIGLMGGTLNRMAGFTLKTDLLANKVSSTANYIGLFNEESARVPTVFFEPGQNNYRLRFDSTLFMGMRQMSTDEWIGSPMYKLTFASNETALALRTRCPLEVELEIKDRVKDKEKLTITGIRDAKGNSVAVSELSLQLQTLTDEHGYWLDTGIFRLDIVGKKE